MSTPSTLMEMLAPLASLMGVFAFCQGLLHTVIPPGLRSPILKLFARLHRSFSNHCLFDIAEMNGVNTNELYGAVQLHLSGSASVSGSRLSLTRGPNASAFTFTLSTSDSLVDSFQGAPIAWEHVVTPRQSPSYSSRGLPDEKRHFTLRIRKKDKPRILEPYLNHIMDKAAEAKRKNRNRLLYTNSKGPYWESVPFKHPSTFDTLAMDPARKEEIKKDLKDFTEGEAFYESTGRAWKRGYLLHGPPGTGKSSMIAAMANFIGYDIYDLELTEVESNSELRKLLMRTTAMSIIVIEDIDCSISLLNRKGRAEGGKKAAKSGEPAAAVPNNEEPSGSGGRSLTLSGMLNLTDGLWSCCGNERIFVFTTNHVEKLDPALLRSGRMDRHVFMGCCTFPALKILMKNYLGLEEDGEEAVDRKLMRKLERAVDGAQMTPADVSEVLIKNRQHEKGRAVRELLAVMKGRVERKTDVGEGRAENEEEQEKRAVEVTKLGGAEAAAENNCHGKQEEAAVDGKSLVAV